MELGFYLTLTETDGRTVWNERVGEGRWWKEWGRMINQRVEKSSHLNTFALGVLAKPHRSNFSFFSLPSRANNQHRIPTFFSIQPHSSLPSSSTTTPPFFNNHTMADETKTTDPGIAEPLAQASLTDKKEMPKLDNKADGPLFQDIDGDQEVTEIESLCMNCHENVCIALRFYQGVWTP